MLSCHRLQSSEYFVGANRLSFMKFPSVISYLIPLLGGTSLMAVADTFTLKNGTVLEGKIVPPLRADVYTIEYQLRPGIKDIKTVPKADVVKIVTEKLDEKAFEPIAKLVPTPDFLTAEEYKQRLAAVKAYIAKYPKSSKLKEANDILKTLSDESAEVEAGGRKFQGIMIKAAEYRANAFDLDARALETKIRNAAKNGQLIVALRAFAELDKEFQTATCYREVLPAVVKVLQTLRAQLKNSVDTFDARMEKQTAELEAMSPANREDTKRAIEQEVKALEQLYQQEKSAQQTWVTPNAKHKASMDEDLGLADSELQRLTTLPPATTDGGKVFRSTWKTIHSDADAETMEKALAAAEAAPLPERYLKMLQDAYKASGVKPTEEK